MAYLHSNLRLHINNEYFYVEPSDAPKEPILLIDRVSHEARLTSRQEFRPNADKVIRIYGIVGTIKLISGPYLLVITDREFCGKLLNEHEVYRITAAQYFPFAKTTTHLNEQQQQDNRMYETLIDAFFKMDHFYFSYTYDLTHTISRLYNTSPEFRTIQYISRAEERFLWNRYLQQELIATQTEHAPFCLPVISGFVSINDCQLGGTSFQYALISRRSCLRAGTRFYMRGVDSEGNVANYVETEQILQYRTMTASFVQTRGSMPFFWSQLPNLKYKPRPLIAPGANHVNAFRNHFSEQIYIYGRNTVINLVDQRGSELRLEQQFSSLATESQLNDIAYVAFDFHKECSKMRWDRLSRLMDRIEQIRSAQGFFLIDSQDYGDLKPQRTQDGIFRTNCMDCLDRTNVVQGLIARRVLDDLFRDMGIAVANQPLVGLDRFEQLFKNVWADNADACSAQYAGTGALKTDFTRTGRRSMRGLVQDGVNSLVRYVRNNFSDGHKQDSIDLLLGNYVVSSGEGVTLPSPLRAPRDWKFYTLPVLFLITSAMFALTLLMPSEQVTEQVAYSAFWGAGAVLSIVFIVRNGYCFVDRPRLRKFSPAGTVPFSKAD